MLEFKDKFLSACRKRRLTSGSKRITILWSVGYLRLGIASLTPRDIRDLRHLNSLSRLLDGPIQMTAGVTRSNSDTEQNSQKFSVAWSGKHNLPQIAMISEPFTALGKNLHLVTNLSMAQ